jgi:hypothetical protein
MKNQFNLAKTHIKPPFVYDKNDRNIYDSENNMICSVRGWGRFQYLKNGIKIHDNLGEYIAHCINKKMD